ncbi:hypothetical protein ARMGADRAFT_1037025 [Armillaria gallica]|uniref:Uncharacterized protein n=1 Tax=Armillaria gallica TaxID=47427 RepID=A0A2H3DAL3_ARMGA|nr:hypothetical protein ARMGADRAFT_1037025 [Armillaria gallica]
MILCDTILDPRFIILDLDSTILEDCKFKVALALEFEHHVLAFRANDKNTRVFWFATEEYHVKNWSYIPHMLRPSLASFDLKSYLSGFNELSLSSQPYTFVDSLAFYDGFLAMIVWFIVLIRKRKQIMVQKHEANCLFTKYHSHGHSEDLEAAELKHKQPARTPSPSSSVDEDDLFDVDDRKDPSEDKGIGVYASSEILHKTGIPPMTPTREVFCSPSHTQGFACHNGDLQTLLSIARQHIDPFELSIILDALHTPGHLRHLIFGSCNNPEYLDHNNHLDLKIYNTLEVLARL